MPVRPIERGLRPWNKGLLVGQKKPLEPKHVWSIRVRLEIARSRRDLVIFNLAIDSKLRACDLVRLRLDDICSGANVRHRATIIQKKTGRPVQHRLRCGAPRRRRRLPPSPTQFHPAPQHGIAQAKFLGHRPDRATARSDQIDRLPLIVVRKRSTLTSFHPTPPCSSSLLQVSIHSEEVHSLSVCPSKVSRRNARLGVTCLIFSATASSEHQRTATSSNITP